MGCLALAVNESESQGERKNGEKNNGRTMKDPRLCTRCDGEGRHKVNCLSKKANKKIL